MTVFLEVAKTVIRDTIETIIRESKAANKSFLSRLRDTQLSEAKCARLESILEPLKTIRDGENDEATLIELQTLIAGCIEDVKAESSASSHKEGTTEVQLRGLLTALPSICLKLESLPLINTPYDTDALSHFRYFMALYYAKKIVRENAPSFKPDQWLDSGRSFGPEQDQLVQKALTQCTHYIETLDGIAAECPRKISAINETDFSFRDIRIMQVHYHIHSLRAAHAALKARYTYTTSVFSLDADILEESLKGVERVLKQQLGKGSELRERHDSADGLSTPRSLFSGGPKSVSSAAGDSEGTPLFIPPKRPSSTRPFLGIPVPPLDGGKGASLRPMVEVVVEATEDDAEEDDGEALGSLSPSSVMPPVFVGKLAQPHESLLRREDGVFPTGLLFVDEADKPARSSIERSDIGADACLKEQDKRTLSTGHEAPLAHGLEQVLDRPGDGADGLMRSERPDASTQLMLDTLLSKPSMKPMEMSDLPADDAHFSSPVGALSKKQKRQLKRRDQTAAQSLGPAGLK